MRVGAEIDTPNEGALFANCGELLFLWRCSHEDGGIVTKDTSENLENYQLYT